MSVRHCVSHDLIDSPSQSHCNEFRVAAAVRIFRLIWVSYLFWRCMNGYLPRSTRLGMSQWARRKGWLLLLLEGCARREKACCSSKTAGAAQRTEPKLDVGNLGHQVDFWLLVYAVYACAANSGGKMYRQGSLYPADLAAARHS